MRAILPDGLNGRSPSTSGEPCVSSNRAIASGPRRFIPISRPRTDCCWALPNDSDPRQRLRAAAVVTFVAALAAPLSTLRAARHVQSPPDSPLTLWYRQPANEWVEALPIGNGRLAAMVFGGIEQERIQLNEDTLWAGGPYDPANPRGARGAADRPAIDLRREVPRGARACRARRCSARPRAADAISAGRRSPADVSRRGERERLPPGAGPRYGGRARHVRVGRRALHPRGLLEPVDQVIAIRLTADRPGQHHRHGRDDARRRTRRWRSRTAGRIVMRGVNAESQGIKGALKFEARVRVVAQGGADASDKASIAVTRCGHGHAPAGRRDELQELQGCHRRSATR